MNAKMFSLVLTAVITGVMVMTGCATTTGMQRSENTGSTMKIVEQDISQAVVQLDATDASLDDLVKLGQPGIKKAYDLYDSNVGKMEEAGKRFLEHAEKMSLQGKDYFEEWRKQGNTYTNSQIQALSEQRRADLSAIFAGISESSVGVKGSLKEYLSDIRQIQVYLSNDLTPKGIEGVNEIAEKAVIDGKNVKSGLNEVHSAIAKASEALSEGGVK
jgi:outer membrane murein-binding lipoprotein Lpp